MIVRGQKSIGMSIRQSAPVTLPGAAENPNLIIQDLAQRLANLETLVERKADSGAVRSLIAISPEAIKIQARDIVLAGTVTIADVFGEYNGTNPGAAPAKLTIIRGNVIQTGQIKSNNYGADEGSAWDLDNSTLVMGGSASPKFLYDGEDLTLSGTITAGSVIADSVTVGGVTLGNIKDNAQLGGDHAGLIGNVHNVALDQIFGDLDDIADGSAYFRTTFDQRAGAERAYGALDNVSDYVRSISTQKLIVSGTNPLNGIVFDDAGLRAYQSGAPTLVINAVTGSSSWGGDVVTGGQMYATGSTSSSQGNGCIVGVASSSGVRGVIGTSIDTSGVVGVSSSGVGVLGVTASSVNAAVEASNTGGGPALNIVGHITKARVAGHLIDIWDHATNTFVGTYEFRFRLA